MYMEHFPEQFKVASELASVIGVKEESRVGVIQALWNYIKIQGLQDKTDRRMVHADEKLMQVSDHPPVGSDAEQVERCFQVNMCSS